MKIVEVSVYPAAAQKHGKASGVASYAKNLYTNLPRTQKDEVYVLANKLEGQASAYDEDGLHIIRAFDRNWRYVFQLYRSIRRLRPDVVHFQQELNLYGGMITAVIMQFLLLALRLGGVCTVLTMHHVVDLRKVNRAFVRANSSKAPVWMVKLALLIIYCPLTVWARNVIVHEASFKQVLMNQYRVPARKLHVVPHGVEDLHGPTVARARKQLGLRPKQHVVLSMGYLAGYKDYDLLVEAFGLYAAIDPDAFLLVGAGKHPKLEQDPGYLAMYNDTKAKAKALIPKDRYRWIGFIPEADIPAYYAAADVSVYPYKMSLSSSGPMAIAMGYEQPFLGSEAYADVLPARVLFAHTPAGLAAKLQEFFANQPAYRDFSRQLKRERLWHTVGARTWRVYKEAAHEA